jgi:hypothetical protein
MRGTTDEQGPRNPRAEPADAEDKLAPWHAPSCGPRMTDDLVKLHPFYEVPEIETLTRFGRAIDDPMVEPAAREPAGHRTQHGRLRLLYGPHVYYEAETAWPGSTDEQVQRNLTALLIALGLDDVGMRLTVDADHPTEGTIADLGQWRGGTWVEHGVGWGCRPRSIPLT